MKRALSALLLVCLLGTASATIVRQLDLPGLLGGAALVVEGRCVSVRVERGAHDLPVTVVAFQVEHGHRGAEAGEIVTFRVPGGELGDRGLLIPGMPAFAAGEELFLFLTAPSPAGISVPVGLGQGKLRITRDPSGRPQFVERDLAGLDLVDAAGQPVDAPGPARLRYEAFRAEVLRLLEAER